MKNKRAKIVVFLSTILVGFLIAGNFSFEGFNSAFQLKATEYQDAVETKSKLLKEIGALKSSNHETMGKISQYKNNDVDNSKIVEDMKNQVKDYGMITGLNEVTGQGIVIIINDGVMNNDTDTAIELRKKTFHDSDMFLLLNELKSSGAEALAINNHRISPMTALTCKYAFLEFEDGDMEYAPFNIYAIGDTDTMLDLLKDSGSYLQQLINRGLSVEILPKESIKLKAANIPDIKYAEQHIKK